MEPWRLPAIRFLAFWLFSRCSGWISEFNPLKVRTFSGGSEDRPGSPVGLTGIYHYWKDCFLICMDSSKWKELKVEIWATTATAAAATNKDTRAHCSCFLPEGSFETGNCPTCHCNRLEGFMMPQEGRAILLLGRHFGIVLAEAI